MRVDGIKGKREIVVNTEEMTTQEDCARVL